MNAKRVNYLTLASVIAAFAVVTMHVNEVFWEFSTEKYWVSANAIDSILYFAVPVFFMISGATLIDYRDRYSTKEYFKKRVDKTVIPFLVWTMIGIAFIRITREQFPLPLNLQECKEIILQILNNNFVGVYWFFTPLFCVYLCIPLFSAIEKELRVTVFQYLIGIGFVFNIALPFITNVFQWGYNNPLQIGVVSNYLFYVLVGYVINKQRIEKKWRLISYVLGVTGLFVQMIGTYVTSMQAGYVVTIYKDYTNLPSVLYSVAVFIFIKELSVKIKSEKVWRFINWVAKYTFAIYLMHWYVMCVLKKIFQFDIFTISYRLIAPIIICAACVLCAWIMRKIPVIKKMVP